MSGLPSAEDIRAVHNVTDLQEACLKIIRICEKESDSKKKYRNAAAALKSELEEVTAKLSSSPDSSNPLPTDVVQLRRSLTMCQSTISDLNCEIQRLSTQLHLREGEVNQQQVLIQNLESQHESAQETIRLMEDQTKNGASNSLVRHFQVEKEQLSSRVQELERSLCSARDDIKSLKQKPSDDATQRSAALGLPAQSVGGDADARAAALAFELQSLAIAKEEAEKSLRDTIEKNQTRSKERLNRLKARNRELAAANEEQQRAMRTEIESLRAALQERDGALSAREAKLARLGDVSRERDLQAKAIAELQRKLAECEGALERSARLSGEVAELREKLLEANLANDGNEKSVAMAEQSIQEKNATMANLRTLLDKAVKSDERKQQQIEELQHERTTLNFRLQNALREIEAGPQQQQQQRQEKQQPAVVQQLRQANAELEARNRKLQELLEKSHEVYAALRTEYDRLTDKRAQGDARFATHSCVVFESNERSRKKGMSSTAEKEAKLVKAAYLRRVVLQFFSQELESERGTMVPLILELVGCTQEQISVVMRHYSRSQHLIAKTSGLFGF
jgi:chromosome segregation ATPase